MKNQTVYLNHDEHRQNTFLKLCKVADDSTVSFEFKKEKFHLTAPPLGGLKGFHVLVNSGLEVFVGETKIGDATEVKTESQPVKQSKKTTK